MNKSKALSAAKNLIYPLAGVLVFIAAWVIAAEVVGFHMILPPPSLALKSLGNLLKTQSFYSAVFSTLIRSLRGFAVSFLLAALLAVLSSASFALRKILSPMITILRSVPTMSIMLITLIMLKSTTAPMFIAGLIVFPAMYESFYSAISLVDKDIVEMSKAYKVTRLNVLTKFYIPATAPLVFDTVRASVSLNLKVVIASEVLAQTSGSLGLMMQRSSAYLDTAQLLAWTIAAIAVSYALEIVVALVKKAVIRW